MPKFVEDCVKKIHGINKRTGKPYTDSEKYAICNAAWNKKQGKSAIKDEIEFIEDDPDVILAQEEVENEMDDAMKRCVIQKLRTKKAKTRSEAEDMCEMEMEKSGYNPKRLEFLLDKELIEITKEM